MPSGKPGKFSTTEVVVNRPPGCRPVNTSGRRFARAAYRAAVSPAQPEPIITTFSIEWVDVRIERGYWQEKEETQPASPIDRRHRAARGSITSNRFSILNFQSSCSGNAT